MKNVQRIKNWQHLCIFGRLCSDTIDTDGKVIWHDGRNIRISVRDDHCYVDYIDNDTGELLLTQGEDGFPTYESEWAKQTPKCQYEIA